VEQEEAAFALDREGFRRYERQAKQAKQVSRELNLTDESYNFVSVTVTPGIIKNHKMPRRGILNEVFYHCDNDHNSFYL